jgi:hypothetical protein
MSIDVGGQTVERRRKKIVFRSLSKANFGLFTTKKKAKRSEERENNCKLEERGDQANHNSLHLMQSASRKFQFSTRSSSTIDFESLLKLFSLSLERALGFLDSHSGGKQTELLK